VAKETLPERSTRKYPKNIQLGHHFTANFSGAVDI
jgi:hypothetical protein